MKIQEVRKIRKTQNAKAVLQKYHARVKMSPTHYASNYLNTVHT